jgi:DNA-binding response OmpR family regulator
MRPTARRGCVLESETFDLVLLDLALPGQSGIELLPQIKERQPDCPSS